MLCLVDKGVEACRYLQTYGQWDLATWLAKVRFNKCSTQFEDSCDVLFGISTCTYMAVIAYYFAFRWMWLSSELENRELTSKGFKSRKG